MTTTEVWLYGSTARGDCDSRSDVDVLVAGEDEIELAGLGLPAEGTLSLTRYSWHEIEQMAGYGSLFLHHVRLEGEPVVESPNQRMRHILDTLPSYTRAQIELNCFRQVLDDVEYVVDGDHSPTFELSVVATAARHAAILGCYSLGEPDFGRSSAFRRLLPRLGYSPTDVEEFVHLYTFRQAENEGRILNPDVTARDVRVWVARVRRLLDQVEGEVG